MPWERAGDAGLCLCALDVAPAAFPSALLVHRIVPRAVPHAQSLKRPRAPPQHRSRTECDTVSLTPAALRRFAPLPHRMPHPPSASPHAASSPLSPAGKVSSRALRLLSAAYTSLALRSAAALLGLDSPAALALRE